jgi:hypothetical protein
LRLAPGCAAELLPLVYDELRKLAAARMAAEPAGHSLQPTALFHEAYLRLVGGWDRPGWDGPVPLSVDWRGTVLVAGVGWRGVGRNLGDANFDPVG